ncbi:hypothetical protein D6C80_08947 [Aureobasidium pullulans]|nr:hypothetical protein D6C80_08947 [Aureobasidium pullulans]
MVLDTDETLTGLFDEMNDRLDQRMIDMLEPSPDDGNTALHWLVKLTLHRPILTQSILRKFLVIGDVGCSPQNLIRNTPLHVAIAADHVTLARMLIQNGAVLTARDDLERTPLDLAKDLSRTQIIADIEAQLIEGDSKSANQNEEMKASS